MKVYVDELPKSCGDCEFCKQTEYYSYYCDKLHIKLGYFNKEKDCPLQTLADHEKQVRKQVCNEIGGEIYTQMIVYGKELRYSDLNLILDKIEKGE